MTSEESTMLAQIAATVNKMDGKLDAMSVQQGQHQVMLTHDKEKIDEHDKRLSWLEKMVYTAFGAGGLGGAAIVKLYGVFGTN